MVDQLFRLEAGKIMAVLTRVLGRSQWEVCEEIVQETLLKALQVWSMHGTPDNPAAWMMTVAKNKAIDHFRKQRRERQIVAKLAQGGEGAFADIEASFGEQYVRDDQLRLLFACATPLLSETDRVMLTLKIVCGLSHAEIAAALFFREESVRKRLYRAREALKDDGFTAEESTPEEVASRVHSVLTVLYLMFNEGYRAHQDPAYIRFELCAEALRLATELEVLIQESSPTLSALMALMHFQMARFPARLDSEGSIVLLQEQDRTRWDAGRIKKGFESFRRSARGKVLSPYHLEAAIASHHVSAPRFEETDWAAIHELYDRLTALVSSASVRLNRAIAVGFHLGPSHGLAELTVLKTQGELLEYPALHAAEGEFLFQTSRFEAAAACFALALAFCTSPRERHLLDAKRRACLAKINP